MKKRNSHLKGHLDALSTGLKYLTQPNRMTLDYPAESMKLDANYRGFFSVKDKICIGCSLCEIVCPPKAITMLNLTEQGGKKKKRPMIDWGLCIFCYFCVDICPTDAFQTSQVHDLAFYNVNDYQGTDEKTLKYPFSYDEFNRDEYEKVYAKFHDQLFKEPSEKARKVISKPDVKRGIKYEPVDKS